MKRTFPNLVQNLVLLFVTSSVIFLALASTAAVAGEKIDQSLDFIEDGKIDISNVNGKIELFGWKKKQVKVVGELSDQNKTFIFERHGNRIEIRMREKNQWGSGKGDNLKIYIPKRSNVSFESPNTGLDIKTIHGSVDLEAVNGNIDVHDVEGRLRVEVVNGNIYCENVKGRINLEVVNGNVKASKLEGEKGEFSTVNGNLSISGKIQDVKTNAVSGDINIFLQDVENFELETVSGDATIEVGLLKNAAVHANSVAGEIDFIFLKNPSADFDISTHTGGSISNKLSKDEAEKASHGPGRSLKFSHNGGNGSVSVTTLHGDISLSNK